jgi:hypothetical protein
MAATFGEALNSRVVIFPEKPTQEVSALVKAFLFGGSISPGVSVAAVHCLARTAPDVTGAGLNGQRSTSG